ncbi:MAG: hypothetical protein VKJ31_01495, partial [Synechococcus sp.]|nr:hypothetical protein [Synechococcus sp.]
MGGISGGNPADPAKDRYNRAIFRYIEPVGYPTFHTALRSNLSTDSCKPPFSSAPALLRGSSSVSGSPAPTTA